MSKTVDFKIPIVLPDGHESEKETVGDVLAGMLASSDTKTVEDVMKIGGWWKSLSKKEAITLDSADEKKLRDLVANSDRATAFIKIQILEILDAETSKEKKK